MGKTGTKAATSSARRGYCRWKRCGAAIKA